MPSLSILRSFYKDAKSVLFELGQNDSSKYQNARALQALTILNRGLSLLEELASRNPGFTEHCEDLKELKADYDLLNLRCRALLGPNLGLIDELFQPSPSKIPNMTKPQLNFNRYIPLFNALDEAEMQMAKARSKLISLQEALDSLYKAELTIESFKNLGEEIPETLIERISSLKGYTAL